MFYTRVFCGFSRDRVVTQESCLPHANIHTLNCTGMEATFAKITTKFPELNAVYVLLMESSNFKR